jgi:hypothetical protein
MDYLGKIDDRQIFYTTLKTTNWHDELPADNWIAIPIADESETRLIGTLAKKCLEKHTLCVCAAGKQCKLIHNIFDHYAINRRNNHLEKSADYYSLNKVPLTTWHKNLDEGFWFATSAAFPTINDEYMHVDKVVCIDLTSQERDKLANLVTRINSGWVPSDR